MGLPNGGPFFPMAQSSTHSSTQSSAINYKRLFRDVFFDRRSVRSVVLIALSMALVALFPLVTQFYLHVAFHRTTYYLLLTTFVIALIYLVKLFIDIHVARFENKLYIKLRANLHRRLIQVFLERRYGFERMHEIAVRNVGLYVLFVRKVLFENFKSVVKVIISMLLIYFFDIHLFVYCLFFLPVFGLYVFLFHRIFHRNRADVERLSGNFNGDIAVFIEHHMSRSSLKENIFDGYRKFESLSVEKELRNRNSTVALNQALIASITFFRVLYLCYFGYFIITQHLFIERLIVGLLFITILIRSFISILETLLFFYISRNSVIEIQKLLKS